MNDRMSPEERDYYARTRKPVLPMPTTRLGKLGCGFALVVWFTILLTPCALFWLAFQGDIVISHGSIPEPQEHPLLRISLIMDADQRGFQFTRSILQPSQAEDALCVETVVNYLMWQSKDSAPPAVYCDCYSRTQTNANWFFDSREESACKAD